MKRNIYLIAVVGFIVCIGISCRMVPAGKTSDVISGGPLALLKLLEN